MQAALQVDVLAAGEEVVQRGLLQRGADLAAHGRPLRGDVEARDGRAPAGRRQQRREHQTVVDLPAPLGPRKP